MSKNAKLLEYSRFTIDEYRIPPVITGAKKDEDTLEIINLTLKTTFFIFMFFFLTPLNTKT